MKTRRLSATFATAVLALTLAACGSSGGSASSGSASGVPGAGATAPGTGPSGGLVLATTVSPITSIVSTVAGDKAQVKGIVPEGTNSHTFEPAPQVAELLSTADIIFVNGLKLEEPTKKLAETNMKPGAEIVDIGSQVLPESDYIYDFSFPKSGGKPNPHLWTDPLYAIKYAQVVADSLAAKDPANASYYQGNAKAFEAKATELADALRTDQETIPNGNRKLLTYHDAYAYFAKDFGWEVIGAAQPENFQDPNPQEIAALIEQVKAEKVPTIFGSEVFPSKVLQEVGEATGARYEDSLRDDDLPGAPGDAEHSWLGLMRYDYITIVKGLGGTTTNLEKVDVQQSPNPDTADYPQ